jgi:hypothetical protein
VGYSLSRVFIKKWEGPSSQEGWSKAGVVTGRCQLYNMSKNVRNRSRTDFDGKDTTARTLKARKKVAKNFLSCFLSVYQILMVYRKKVGRNFLSYFLSAYQTLTIYIKKLQGSMAAVL